MGVEHESEPKTKIELDGDGPGDRTKSSTNSGIVSGFGWFLFSCYWGSWADNFLLMLIGRAAAQTHRGPRAQDTSEEE